MLEPRFTVAVAVYAFASNNRTRGFLRIDKSDHAQLGWVPDTAGRCDSIKDQIGGQFLALVPKQAIDPRPGPRMIPVLGEGPRSDPQRGGLRVDQYGRSEKARA